MYGRLPGQLDKATGVCDAIEQVGEGVTMTFAVKQIARIRCYREGILSNPKVFTEHNIRKPCPFGV